MMSHRVLNFAGAVCAAVWLLATPVAPVSFPAFAQNNDAKPADQQAAPKDTAKDATKDGAKEPQKVDEYVEARRVLNGPAGNPECVWLGRRVVRLLLRDDLDTAFRHLDLYDRFGCPSGHIQATFRCLVVSHADAVDSKADPKAADSLLGRVQACWINPSLEVAPTPEPAPAAAVPSPTTTR
ncbi:MAG TPA: beta-1-3, beta-1-6-glucan biosynthesis protein [Xanthobacteraceae bacterium]